MTKFLLPIFLMLAITFNSNAQNTDTTTIQNSWMDMMLEGNNNFYEIQTSFNEYWQNRTRQKGDGWKVFKRWESYWQTRVNADGSFPVGNATLKAYEQMQAGGGQLFSTNGSWISSGPTPLPGNTSGQPNGLGRVNVVVEDPSNAQTLWVGTPSGGLWKSTNGGGSWSPKTDNMPTLGITSLLIDTANTSIMYMGTGDGDGNDAPGLGVYKSTDGGNTWNASNSGITNATVSKLVFGITNSIILAATNSGIYRSSNSGATWIKRSSTANFRDVVYKPNNANIAYATSYSHSSGAKFYRSINGGNSWAQVTTGLTNTGYRMSIGVSPANANTIYLVAGDDNGLVAIYKSLNGGLNFTSVYSTLNILGREYTGSGTSSQAWYDLAISVSPTNANIVHVGGINVWKSINGGTSWSLNGFWLDGYGIPVLHADHHFLGYSPSGVLYNGNDGGVSKSLNNGTSWTDISSGLGIAQIYKIGQSSQTAHKTMAGFQDNGTAYQSALNTWTTVIGGDGMECIIDPSDDNYKYGALYYGDIRRSVSGSSFYTIAENGTNGINEDGAWVTPYVLAEGQTATMFAGYENIWRSTNVKAVNSSSISFSKITNFTSTDNITIIENSPINNAILYIAKGSATAYRSINALSASPAWVVLGTLGSSTITDIEAHPTNANIVYATAGNNIYKSVNKGSAWTNITGNIPSGAKNCIVYDTSSTDGLYVGTDIGVFYKDATMTNWVNYSLGLPAAGEVTELEIYYNVNRNNSKIKAATYGRGLWSSDLYSSTNSIAVDFSVDYTSGCAGSVLEFTDLTAPLSSIWQWTITPSSYTYVSGTSAASQNPKVQFNTSGNYTIKLVAGSSSGLDSITKVNYISISTPYSSPLVEDFASFTVGAPGTLSNGWTIENSGAFDWRVNNNGTSSPNTGPNSDNTIGGTAGIYMYTEATSPALTGEVTSLISPCISIPSLGQTDLTFYYHMYGASISALNVDIYTNGYWTNNIYTITGPKQFSNSAPWLQASVSLAAYTGATVKLRFRVIRGNDYTCDIAIDDIFIGQSGGVVANFNANELTPVVGSIVQFTDSTLNSPSTWNWSFTPSTVSFVGGTSANSQNPKVKFNAAGSYSAKLVASNAVASDSLVKSSYIMVQSANSIPSIETFQTFTVGSPGVFVNGWSTSTIGNFPWYVNTGTTTSSNTGPNADHTTGNISGKYLYTEATAISTADVAILESPYYDFSSTTNPRVSFWYHMFGQDIIGLDMDVFYNGAWVNNVNQIVSQQHTSNAAAYTETTVNLDAYANSVIKFRFRVTHMVGNVNSTYRSDIAIDDFSAFAFVSIVNDEPCGAIELTVSDTCNYSTFSNVNATTSIGILPPGCGGSISEDVWFKLVVPNSGAVIIDAQPLSGGIVDGAMAAYTGSCSSLTLLSCNDDYQGSNNLPHIELSNQTPGDTIYVRFWKFGGGVGSFQMCVSRPPYFMVSPNSITTTYAAGSSTINVLASSTITWSVSESVNWLTLSPSSATGSASFTATYSANSGGPRSAIIIGIAAGFPNQTVTITQNGYITADYTSPNTMLCQNYSEAFINTSQNAISSIWYVNGVQQATTTNFNYTFNSIGKHTVKLKIIGAFYNDSISRNYFIGASPLIYAGNDTTICEGEDITINSSVVTGLIGCDSNCAIPTYCNSNSNNDGTEYIIKVKVGNVEVSSTKSGLGFQDFSSSLFMPVNTDSTYLITVTGFTTGSWVEYVDVFVDWNRNGLFDEAVISLGTATFLGSHNFNGFITAPANAVLGKTKMRVIMKYATAITSGCQTGYNYGETEDYMLEIVKDDTLDYSWSGPMAFTSTDINPIINNIATSQSGNYVLNMSNAYSCISTDSAAITVEPYPNVNINNIPDACLSGIGIILTQGSPAGGNYSGPGVSSGIFVPSLAGIGTHNIIYTATTSSGCSNSDTTTITVNALPILSFNSLPAQLCANSTNITLTASPSGGSFTGMGVELINQFNPSLAGNGVANVTYHYTNSNQCSDSLTQSVMVNTLPIVSAGTGATIPYGGIATLNGQISSFNTCNLEWLPASLIMSISNGSAVTQPLTASQEFTFKATDLVTNCSDSDMVMINVTGGPLSLIVTGSQSSVCYGDSLQLLAIASGGVGTYTYSWTSSVGGFTNNTYNPTVAPFQNTWYRVAVSDNSTTLYDSVFVEVIPNPIPNFDIVSSVCEFSQSINMTNMTPAGGVFSGVGVVGNTFNALISGVGTHSITYSYTNNNGCTFVKTKDITVNANPVIIMNHILNVCSSSANINLNMATPYGGTYSGNYVSNNTFNTSSAGVGNHSIFYMYTDQNGCSSTKHRTIAVVSSPIADAGIDQYIVQNTSTTLLAAGSGGSGNYSYQWKPSAMVINASSIVTHTVTLSNSQLYKVVVTDNQTMCSDSDNVVIAIVGTPLDVDINIPQNPICEGDSMELTAVPSGASGTYSYSWTSSPVGFTSSIQNPIVSPSSTTAYMVVISEGASTANDGKFVIVDAAPLNSLPIDTGVCDNSSVELDAGGGYDNYQWSNGDSTRKLIVDGSAIPNGNTMYYVTITNTNGCSLKDSVSLALNLSPSNMLGNDTSICQQASITLDGGDNMMSYLWNTNDDSQTIIVDGSIGMGNYTYWVRSESVEGCIGTDSISLDIIYCNSIQDIENDNYSVKLYPNPNNGNFNIDVQSNINDDVSITVIDSRGREVSRDKMPILIGENSKNISISNLSKGMYIIYLRGENIYSVRKLIIK